MLIILKINKHYRKMICNKDNIKTIEINKIINKAKKDNNKIDKNQNKNKKMKKSSK